MRVSCFPAAPRRARRSIYTFAISLFRPADVRRPTSRRISVAPKKSPLINAYKRQPFLYKAFRLFIYSLPFKYTAESLDGPPIRDE